MNDKKKKRLLSLLMLLMLSTLVYAEDINIVDSSTTITTTGARTTELKWSDFGAYDISWYNGTDKEFYISTPKELAGIAYLVNNNITNFYGKTIHINNDIDLQGKNWIPIGSTNMPFNGTIIGNGFTISNVTIKDSRDGYSGFFAIISGAKVQNLHLDCSIFNNYGSYFGAIAGKAAGTEFYNIKVDVNITSIQTTYGGSTSMKFERYIGGTIGSSKTCTYKNVTSNTNITYEFGQNYGRSCYESIYLYVGGLVGIGERGHLDWNIFEKCQTVNTIDVSINSYKSDDYYSHSGNSQVYYGGIIGGDNNEKTSITSCFSKNIKFHGKDNYGSYVGVNFNYGGIVGYMNQYDYRPILHNCVAINSNYCIDGQDYKWYVSGYNTNSRFGGITGEGPKNMKYCYSNNDVVKEINQVGLNNQGEDGSTPFSIVQMNSQAFVDEINFLNQLEYGNKNWGLNELGNLILLDFYRLIYILDGKEYSIENIAYGTELVQKDALVKEGHTFSGWSEIPATMPAQDVTVTGSFTVNSYTITYKVDGEVYATEEVAYGEVIVLKEAPEKDGYIFSGWSEVPETMPAEDLEVTGSFASSIKAVITKTHVDVYSLQGMLLKRQILVDELKNELPQGLYIVDGKKVLVK